MKTRNGPGLLLFVSTLIEMFVVGGSLASQNPAAGASTSSSCITRDGDCAVLHCAFQKLDGRVSQEGLWLHSTVEISSAPFRVWAASVGRQNGETKPLALKGEVQVTQEKASLHRPDLDEEYTVSMNGVQQDFVLTQRPVGTQSLEIVLQLDGASAEQAPDGASLVLAGSGRKLAYNKLRVIDARRRELPGRLQVLSPERILLIVDDSTAVYPLRIDPTFSDANWVPVAGLWGTDRAVTQMAADTNGNIYIAGDFTMIGSTFANHIAKWNGSTWSALGSGISGGPSALACDDYGNIYASPTSSNGVSINNIWKWDGSTWSAIGAGLNAFVFALACDPSGNLYAGGAFIKVGGVSANYIAKWDGGTWSALGSGVNSNVSVMVCDDSGNLYAGGAFTSASGLSANHIAKWDGSSWSALGSGSSSAVGSLACNAAGNLFASGSFTSGLIAEWDGITNWIPISSLPGTVTCDNAGNIYFTEVVAGIYNIKKQNSGGTSQLASGTNTNAPAVLVCDPSGNLYAAGPFSSMGGVAVSGVAKWDGKSWSALGPATHTSYLNCLAFDQKGNLYVGGQFLTASGPSYIAEWNGAAWSMLGSGLDAQPNSLAIDSRGNLYAGGNFTNAGGLRVNCIGKWDGNSWSALGTGVTNFTKTNSSVYSVCCDKADNVYVSGYFTSAGGVYATNIAKWDGSSWSPLRRGLDAGALCLGVDTLNNLYAGGGFGIVGVPNANSIAKWDGTNWSALGQGLRGVSFVYALAFGGSGQLYVGGFFSSAGSVAARSIAKWDGTNWFALGSGIGSYYGGYPYALACDSSGNVFAGGHFYDAGGISATYMAKWDGTNWSSPGSAMNGTVSALAFDPSGNLYAAGQFTSAGGKSSAYLAKALLSKSSYNLALTNLASGTNVITGLGTPNYNYALDMATDLTPPVNWVSMATNAFSDTNLVFTNTSSTAQGFYRTRYVP